MNGGRISFVAVFVLVLTMAFSLTSSKSVNFAEAQKIPNQYIVVLKNNVVDPETVANDMALKHGLGKGQIYGHALKGFSAVIPDAVLEKVRNDPRVSLVEQDQVVQAFVQTLPTGINRVDADLSSTKSGDGSGSVSVDIAIIDTGIDLIHPDLYVYKQKTFVKGTKSANDDNGHGTHVAGIAAAKDNSAGVAGIAPGAKLWAVKVLSRTGSGSMSNVIAGIDYVTANAGEIEVANMSLGCECTSTALNTAISNSVKAGVTYVVAAGNSGKDAATFSPANHPDVIAVSAIVDTDGKCGGLGPSTSYGTDDTFATFSNFGSVVDMAAPGVNIYSTYKSGTYATLSGTSMASPHVTGAAALYKANNPTATPAQVQDALKTLGIPQTKSCDTALNNGNGGFTGDTDGFPEPLVYVASL